MTAPAAESVASADRLHVNELWTLLKAPPGISGDLADPPELRLQAVSTRCGAELLPGLMDAIDRASGWILHRHMVSASMLHMHIEVQGRSLMDLYASLVEEGLELSRDSHLLLAEQCTCAHLHRRARSSIVTLNLDVSLPADLPLLGQWCPVRMA